MQTREDSKTRHPAGTARSNSSGVQAEARSPYRMFFDALTDLELAVAVYGTTSVEADMARAAVRRYREDAAGAWRSQSVTAA